MRTAMTQLHHGTRKNLGMQRSRLRVLASLDNLLEADKREFSSWKMRLANSVVAALFIQCQSSRIAGVGVKSDARESASRSARREGLLVQHGPSRRLNRARRVGEVVGEHQPTRRRCPGRLALSGSGDEKGL